MRRYSYSHQCGLGFIDLLPKDDGTGGFGDVHFGVTGLVAVIRPGMTHAPQQWSDIEDVWCSDCGWHIKPGDWDFDEEEYNHQVSTCTQDPTQLLPTTPVGERSPVTIAWPGGTMLEHLTLDDFAALKVILCQWPGHVRSDGHRQWFMQAQQLAFFRRGRGPEPS